MEVSSFGCKLNQRKLEKLKRALDKRNLDRNKIKINRCFVNIAETDMISDLID